MFATWNKLLKCMFQGFKHFIDIVNKKLKFWFKMKNIVKISKIFLTKI